MWVQRRVTLCTLMILAKITCLFADKYHPENALPIVGTKTSAINAEELTAKHWVDEAQAAIRARLRRMRDLNDGVARNVVMFLGDGMSVPTLAAARTFLGQRANRPGEEAALSFEKFPSVGLSKVTTFFTWTFFALVFCP